MLSDGPAHAGARVRPLPQYKHPHQRYDAEKMQFYGKFPGPANGGLFLLPLWWRASFVREDDE